MIASYSAWVETNSMTLVFNLYVLSLNFFISKMEAGDGDTTQSRKAAATKVKLDHL